MAWLKIESSVARNRKFVKAGPAPSWLWVCGLAYCQEGLTDGFIPAEALNYLGVKNARQLAHHLVTAGLWDIADGGWRVHDYLEHNRSAEQIDELRAKRGNGGKLGGRPKKNLPENLQGSDKETLCETFPVAVADGAAVAAADLKKREWVDFPGDQWWQTLIATYPKARVTTGHLANQAFIRILTTSADGPHATWRRMFDNLQNQMQGHEWRVKGMIPNLQKWLETGAWEQRHEETPASVLLTDRTANTLAAAAAVKRMAR